MTELGLERTEPADERFGEEHAANCRSSSNSSSSASSLSRLLRAISRARSSSACTSRVSPERAEETETAAWDLSSLVRVRLFRCIVTSGGLGTAHATGTEVVTGPSTDLIVLAGASGVSKEPLEVSPSGLSCWGGENPVLSILRKFRCKALEPIRLITYRFGI